MLLEPQIFLPYLNIFDFFSVIFYQLEKNLSRQFIRNALPRQIYDAIHQGLWSIFSESLSLRPQN